MKLDKSLFIKIYKLIILLNLVFLLLSSGYSQTYFPPGESESIVNREFFRNVPPLNENYRKQFTDCDNRNFFNGINMALFRFRNCSDDKNNLKALLKFPDETIFFESKMSIDVDGSWKACCEHPGRTDLCSTAYNFKSNINGETACNSYKRGLYVDPDIYPYIVIPTTTPSGFPDSSQAKEFKQKTNIRLGDVGVVIYKNKMVPVFVADGGPHNKIGEGSSSLFKELGLPWCRQFDSENHCVKYINSSVGASVLYFIFPQSEIPNFRNKTVQERLALIKQTAETKFNRLRNPL